MFNKIINYKADYVDVLLAETGAMAFALLLLNFGLHCSVWIGFGT